MFLKISVFALLIFLTSVALSGFLTRGLKKYRGMDGENTRVLCVGSSRTEQGIDRDLLEQKLGVPVAKYAIGGSDVFDRNMMVRQYLTEHPSTIRYVVLDVDIFTFNRQSLGIHASQLFYPFMDNPEVDSYLRKKAGSTQEYLVRKYFGLLRFNTHTLNLSMRGYLKKRTFPITSTVDMDAVRSNLKNGRFMNEKFPKFDIAPENVSCLKDTIDYITSHGAKVVLLYMPSIDVFRQFDEKHYERVRSLLAELAAENPSILYLDGSKMFEHSYRLFYDPVHMNEMGKLALTGYLADSLKREQAASGGAR